MDWIKHINRNTLVSAKVSTPIDVDMVAVGSYSAGAHIVHMDGGRLVYAHGRGPRYCQRRILPWRLNMPSVKVHDFLCKEGVRDKVTLERAADSRNAHDIAKAIALGADGVVVGTGELVALGCVRCARCGADEVARGA